MTATDVVFGLVSAINAHDVQMIAALITHDHRFLDSIGSVVVGQEKIREGWTTYLQMVPDYRIEVSETYHDGDVTVLLGSARGTYTADGTLRPENAWETPAAWRAVVRAEKVAEWQVYADNEPMRRRIAAANDEPTP